MTGFLLDQFEILADAPGGVRRLRELILQLAVTGRLGTGDKGDEPISEYVGIKSRINTNIKKVKESTENSVKILSLPINWKWLLFANLLDLSSGIGFKADEYVNHGIRLFQIANVTFGNTKWENLVYLPENYIEKYPSLVLKEGDILLALNRPLLNGKIKVAKLKINDVPSILYQRVGRLDLFFPEFSDYLLLYLQSPLFINYIDSCLQGSDQPFINKSNILSAQISLPPLAEQHRIVEKVDSLMALCDDLEAKQTQKHTHLVKLGTGSLNALQQSTTEEELIRWWGHLQTNFGLIFDCVENVEALRQTILQLAVTGRLGTGDDGDEDAHIYLNQISKNYNNCVSISSNLGNILPKKWAISNFGSVTINRDSERIPISKDERIHRKGEYDYYGASGVIDHVDSYLFDKPLLLIGEDGANLINRSTPIAFIAHGKYWVNNHAHVIDTVDYQFMQYLEIFINSIDLKKYITGTAQPKMNQAKMNSIPINVPPFLEQSRIIEKVRGLMALCDQLELIMEHRSKGSILLSNATVQKIIETV